MEELKFGTDGVRAIADGRLEEAAYNLGRAVRGNVILGRDTRVSGERLAYIFSQGAADAGARVTYVGIMPTAGVAYLTKSRGADFGVVISASHNPPGYNGIKVFSSNGTKPCEEEENRLGAALRERFERKNAPLTLVADAGAREEYINFLCSAGERLDGMDLALDCANGAASVIAPEVFARLGANIRAVGVNTGGADINDGCGALHIDTLRRRCPGKFDVYMAFDGDSDRLMALDGEGNILDGDRIMYIIAALTMQKGEKIPCAVGTVLSNGGTEEAFGKLGVKFLRAKVGDKYVKRLMDGCGAPMGGEQSGHIILSKYAGTGDGILTAVVLTSLLKGKSAQEFSYPLYPQYEESVAVSDKSVAGSPEVAALVQKWTEHGVRVLVRPSGTEEKVRIMTECRDKAAAEGAMAEIRKATENAAKA